VIPVPATAEVDQFLADYFAGARESADPGAGPTVAINRHDPGARLQRKPGQVAEFRYQVSFCADAARGLICAATATARERAPTAVEHGDHDPGRVSELAADGLYDAGETLAALQARGVTAYVPTGLFA